MSIELPDVIRAQSHEYRVLHPLDQGGMGSTYLVSRLEDDARFVLKVLHLEKMDDWKALELFRREMGALSSLDHDCIPHYVDMVDDPSQGILGLIQTYVDGQTLQEYFVNKQSLSVDRLDQSLRECLDVLVYLHNRVPPVIHRDLTPRNIMLDADRAYVIDFGAVKVAARESTVMTSVGTFGYMAPEHVLGRAVPASDLYSLGMTFVVLATGCEPGRLPADERTGQIDVSAVLTLPQPMKQVLMRMIQPSLHQRYSTAQEALDALNQTTALARRPPTHMDLYQRPPRYRHKPYSMPMHLHPKRNWWWGLKRVPVFMVLMVLGLFSLSFGMSVVPVSGVDARMGGLTSGHSGVTGLLYGSLTGEYWDYAAYSGKLRFSKDGKRLLSMIDHELVIWDPDSGKMINRHAFKKRRNYSTSLKHFEVSDDGSVVGFLSGYGDKVIHMHRVKTGELVGEFSISQALLSSPTLKYKESRRGDILDLRVVNDKRVDVLWSYSTRQPNKSRYKYHYYLVWMSLGEHPKVHRHELIGEESIKASLHPNLNQLAYSTKGGVVLWEKGRKEAHTVLSSDSKIYGVKPLTFSPDGKSLLYVYDRQLFVYNVAEKVNKKVFSDVSTYNALRVSDDRVIIRSYNQIIVMSYKTGEVFRKERRPYNRIADAILAPNTGQLFTLQHNTQVWRWDK